MFKLNTDITRSFKKSSTKLMNWGTALLIHFLVVLWSPTIFSIIYLRMLLHETECLYKRAQTPKITVVFDGVGEVSGIIICLCETESEHRRKIKDIHSIIRCCASCWSHFSIFMWSFVFIIKLLFFFFAPFCLHIQKFFSFFFFTFPLVYTDCLVLYLLSSHIISKDWHMPLSLPWSFN